MIRILIPRGVSIHELAARVIAEREERARSESYTHHRYIERRSS